MPLPAPSPSTTALVTGASSGIGREIARELARRGHGVTLVARREDRLQQLAAELRDAHDVRVEVLPADLADQDACDRIITRVHALGLDVSILVNNAGFGVYGTFAGSDTDREFEQLAVLIGAVVQLDKLVLPGMLAAGRGAILNVSSTSAFQPLPGSGTYAACKAFVLLHSEALHEEVKDRGVTVTAVCPGPVKTEFQEASDAVFADQLPGIVWASAEKVAEDAIAALDAGKRTVIPGGLLVRLAFAPNRLLPSWLTLPVSRRLFGKELERGDAQTLNP